MQWDWQAPCRSPKPWVGTALLPLPPGGWALHCLSFWVSAEAFGCPCKLWEDMAGCFLCCWNHYHTHPPPFFKEQLHCQSASPCRNHCSFSLQSSILWIQELAAHSTEWRIEEHNNVGKCLFPGFGQPCLRKTWAETNHLQQPLLLMQQTRGERHFLSLLLLMEPAGHRGNTHAHPRCKKVPWKAGKSKFSSLYLFKMQQFNSSLNARHYAVEDS